VRHAATFVLSPPWIPGKSDTSFGVVRQGMAGSDTDWETDSSGSGDGGGGGGAGAWQDEVPAWARHRPR